MNSVSAAAWTVSFGITLAKLRIPVGLSFLASSGDGLVSLTAVEPELTWRMPARLRIGIASSVAPESYSPM